MALGKAVGVPGKAMRGLHSLGRSRLRDWRRVPQGGQRSPLTGEQVSGAELGQKLAEGQRGSIS